MRQLLKYDNSRWKELVALPEKTLQVFITNKCNKRCRGCFYEKGLGTGEMPLHGYKRLVLRHKSEITKVILMGGEPTMHPMLPEMIAFNQMHGLKTTVYTNGFNLNAFDGINMSGVSLRIGVLGLTKGEKRLVEVQKTRLPVTIVYMLRKDNLGELMPTAKYAEENFNCHDFYISSIRDIAATGSFWLDTEETISVDEFAGRAQEFVNAYNGKLERIHIARRGILETESHGRYPEAKECRFLNVFPDGRRVICPFDISLGRYSEEEGFVKRKCNKHSECLLQKIVLERV